MEFKKGDIVSHINSFNKFYIIKENLNTGQYLVEDCEPNIRGVKEEHLFVGRYLLTKGGRRDYVLDDLLGEDKLLDKKI